MTAMAALDAARPDGSVEAGARPLIVHVTRQFAPSRGGLEDVAGNLSRQLVSRGYRVRVVTLNSIFAAPDLALARTEIVDGVEVVRIPWTGSPRYPVAPSVFRHVRDASLVHVHAIDFFFDALAWGRPLHGRPMVATTHGGFFHTPKYAAIKKVWFQTLTRASALAYRRMICCSQSDFQLFSRIAGDRTVTIENGANTEKFAGRAARTPQRRLVTIGRFSVNKRLDRLLDTMRALLERDSKNSQRDAGGWWLDIVGAASDLSPADLQREIDRRGLAAHVRVHANLADDAIAGLIGQASFFVSASEYEGFGLVAVEAMSAGLMPILHQNAAYRMLAARHDPIRLADYAEPQGAAETILSAYDMLLSAGADIRTEAMRATAIYSWNSVADRYADLYETVLRERRT